MKKLCPFRKRIYTDNWTAVFKDMTITTEQHEEFEECVKEECMAWYSDRINRGTYWENIEYCKLCNNRL